VDPELVKGGISNIKDALLQLKLQLHKKMENEAAKLQRMKKDVEANIEFYKKMKDE
tara:strand:- start:1029 stop:1196 length:168 start_codon:yes stop_codon:yes gene_type:complete